MIFWSWQAGGRLCAASWEFRASFSFQYSAPAEKHCTWPVFAAREELDGVSQHSENCRWAQCDNCCSVLADKHKLERFLRPDAALVVTVYAPITFPPASVLLFKQRSNGELDTNVSRLCVSYF